MLTNQYVKDCLVAIDSVKSRIKDAMASGDNTTVTELMGDLTALKVCLEIEIRKELDLNGQKAA